MTFGESREQGVTRGRNFYHEPLGIALTAPQGWQIVRHAPRRSRIVNAAGDAGLVVQAGAAEGRHARTTRSSATCSSPIDAPRTDARTLNGLSATHFVGTRRNEQGQAQGSS